ncbi:hypothetical protein ABH926_003518 [Catenulispora sp. GP43]|uniref:condensation domain-containing protein n=1 Tax=Catenulispora sp. GP43 TaxID=3156263 RepID=UPI0035140E86
MSAEPATATTAPATASQAAMFFAEMKGLYECAYNVTTVIDVAGSFTAEDLSDAGRRLNAATPALQVRMGLDEDTGEVCYRLDDTPPATEVFDLPGGDAAAARALIDEVAARPFDCEGGALARYAVVRTAADRAYVALVCHHLVVDGPSHARLAHRLGQAVGGTLEAEPSRAYTELVRRVRELELNAAADDLAYWHRRLPEGFAPAVPWQREGDGGVGRAGAEAGAGAGAGNAAAEGTHALSDRCILTPLPRRSVERLEKAAESAGVRLFHLLAAAVHWAMPTAAGQPSVISTAASIRPLGEDGDPVTGYFINEIPLLAAKNPGASPLDIATTESPHWREDLRRRYIQFTDLVSRSERRADSQSRLDALMLSYRTTPRGLAWRAGDIGYSTDLYPKFLEEKTDLVVRIFHQSGDMECDVQWSPRLPAGAGERFASALVNVLSDGF